MVKAIKNYGVVILAAVGIALFVRHSFFETYRIPSVSMQPSLSPGDSLFVSKLSYGLRLPFSSREWVRLGEVQRGDVLIYEQSYPVKGQFVKRVVGLPGDRVEIREGKLILNRNSFRFESAGNSDCGAEFYEQPELVDYKSLPVCYGENPLSSMPERELGPEEYFLLSDFRSDFSESVSFKAYAFVKKDSVIGKAIWIWFSTKTSKILSKIE